MQRIAEIAVPCPLRQTFDYLIEETHENIVIGSRVKVPFGSRILVGFVTNIKSVTPDTKIDLKTIIDCLDPTPLLDTNLLTLIHWVSDYYHHPIGECYHVALPKKIRLGDPAVLSTSPSWSASDISTESVRLGKKQQAIFDYIQSHDKPVPQAVIYQQFGACRTVLMRLLEIGLLEQQEQVVLPPVIASEIAVKKLNSEQSHSVKTILNKRQFFNVSLVQGITGSGKTEVYIHLTMALLAAQKQVLILIPEIGLTDQFVARFQSQLAATIVVFHSGMNDRDRQQAWLLAQSGKADVVIGTRSAVFSPLPRLGLIIIDEEHDSAYKQQEGLRYHARQVALMRAKQSNIPVVLGSATPSLESFYHAQAQRYDLLTLTERANGAQLPTIELLDRRGPEVVTGLSSALFRAIERELAKDSQVLLFINQRGYAPVLMCHDCGWQANCPDCDAKMIIHHGRHQLRCHHCGFNQPLITSCPECDNEDLSSYGMGTEQAEQTLQRLFPAIPVLRIDRDSTQKVGAFRNLVAEIQQGGAKILVGTQMLAKGHDFHDVTLVGVLDADQGLFSADFRATEVLAQLITQVTGRAGRGQKAGQVYIQTHQPEHPFWSQLLQHDYPAMVQQLLAERALNQMPPAGSLCLIRARGRTQPLAMTFLTELAGLLNQVHQQSVVVLGPVPAIMEKRAGYYRAQLLLMTTDRKVLHQLLDHVMPHCLALKSSRQVKWSIDVDPIDLM